jgi:hypothetical protein
MKYPLGVMATPFGPGATDMVLVIILVAVSSPRQNRHQVHQSRPSRRRGFYPECDDAVLTISDRYSSDNRVSPGVDHCDFTQNRHIDKGPARSDSDSTGRRCNRYGVCRRVSGGIDYRDAVAFQIRNVSEGPIWREGDSLWIRSNGYGGYYCVSARVDYRDSVGATIRCKLCSEQESHSSRRQGEKSASVVTRIAVLESEVESFE